MNKFSQFLPRTFTVPIQSLNTSFFKLSFACFFVQWLFFFVSSHLLIKAIIVKHNCTISFHWNYIYSLESKNKKEWNNFPLAWVHIVFLTISHLTQKHTFFWWCQTTIMFLLFSSINPTPTWKNTTKHKIKIELVVGALSLLKINLTSWEHSSGNYLYLWTEGIFPFLGRYAYIISM